jgi:hypothetical protein
MPRLLWKPEDYSRAYNSPSSDPIPSLYNPLYFITIQIMFTLILYCQRIGISSDFFPSFLLFCNTDTTNRMYSGGPGFKFRPETGYPDFFRGFPQSLQANYATTASFQILFNSLLTCHPFIRRY